MFNISSSCDLAKISLSLAIYAKIGHYFVAKDGDSVITTIVKATVGSIGKGLLAVAALAEVVVRGILALIAKPIHLCLPGLYSNHFKSWFWATRKLAKFARLKWPNINNIRPLKTGKLHRFGAAENPIFEVVGV